MSQISLFEDTLEEKFQKSIIKDLKRGTSFVDGKKRIIEMYKRNSAKSERIKLLKDEYGVGGYSLQAGGGISQCHDSKGIKIELYTGETKQYNWNELHDLIQILMDTGQYDCKGGSNE